MPGFPFYVGKNQRWDQKLLFVQVRYGYSPVASWGVTVDETHRQPHLKVMPNDSSKVIDSTDSICEDIPGLWPMNWSIINVFKESQITSVSGNLARRRPSS